MAWAAEDVATGGGSEDVEVPTCQLGDEGREPQQPLHQLLLERDPAARWGEHVQEVFWGSM